MENHRADGGHQPRATSLSIVPANQVPWDDLKAVFGDRDSGRCNCQRFKTRGWFWEQATDEQRRAQLRDQANCDDPAATSTTGLVAYLHDQDEVQRERPGRGPRPAPGSSGDARRLGRGRAPHRVPEAARTAHRVEGPPGRGQARRLGLGGHLLRGPQGLPQARHHLRPRRGRRRLREGERRAGARGLRDADPARPGDHLGRAARRRAPGLRRGRPGRGLPPERAPRGHADRLHHDDGDGRRQARPPGGTAGGRADTSRTARRPCARSRAGPRCRASRAGTSRCRRPRTSAASRRRG